jgi:hypothetical protein
MSNADRDENFDENYDRMLRTFPAAHFVISMDFKTLSQILSRKPYIVLAISHNCYCFSAKQEADFIMVEKGPEAAGITIEDAINAIIKYGYNPESMGCTHHFLEGFKKTEDQLFTVQFGS